MTAPTTASRAAQPCARRAKRGRIIAALSSDPPIATTSHAAVAASGAVSAEPLATADAAQVVETILEGGRHANFRLLLWNQYFLSRFSAWSRWSALQA
jgi:hypothetical protein